MGVRVVRGDLALQVVTKAVQNYDYFKASVKPSEVVAEVTFPFSSLRQSWSDPLPWTGRDVLAIKLAVSATEAADFEYYIDRIELY